MEQEGKVRLTEQEISAIIEGVSFEVEENGCERPSYRALLRGRASGPR